MKPHLQQIARVLLVVFLIIACVVFWINTQENKSLDEANNLFKTCKSKPDNEFRYCYGKLLAGFAKKEDISIVLKTLDLVQNLDPRTRDCHMMAHLMSSAYVSKNPKNWQNLIKSVNITSCSYGFLHGSLEELSRSDPSFEINPQTIPKICAMIGKIKNTQNTQTAGCAHIIGHILLSKQCNMPIIDAIKQSTDQCAQIATPLRHECYAGIFMESFQRRNLAAECGTPYVKWTQETAEKQESICKSYSGEAAGGCWQEMAHLYTALTPYDPKKVFQACQRAPTREDIVFCYIHATDGLMLKPNPDSKYVNSVCKPIEEDPEAYGRCVDEVVYSLIYASPKFAGLASSFCKSIPDNYKGRCLSSLSNSAKTAGYNNLNICDNSQVSESSCKIAN